MTKLGVNGDVKTNGKVVEENGDDDEDLEAGPELPLDDEDTKPDDEEGRFFGGGITENTAQVLNFMDEQDKDDIVGHMVAILK